MPTFYMISWSFFMITAMGVWRLRSWGKMVTVGLVTAVILLISQSLFFQLALAAGVHPQMALSQPADFLNQGLVGWLALLVMPCGWLGPVIGLNLVERYERRYEAG
jgi:hypothetical protein